MRQSTHVYQFIVLYGHGLWCVCVCVKTLQLCLTLREPMDCSPPGSSVHGILQARILEWAAIPSSRGSSQPGDWTCISCLQHRPVGSLPLALPGSPWCVVLQNNCNGSIKHRWSQITAANINEKSSKCCQSSQNVTQSLEVSKCCWENEPNSLAQPRAAIKPQFIKIILSVKSSKTRFAWTAAGGVKFKDVCVCKIMLKRLTIFEIILCVCVYFPCFRFLKGSKGGCHIQFEMVNCRRV